MEVVFRHLSSKLNSNTLKHCRYCEVIPNSEYSGYEGVNDISSRTQLARNFCIHMCAYLGETAQVSLR